MFDAVEKRFKGIIPAVDFCSLRLVEERSERILVRQDIVQPVADARDIGAMLTVIHQGGLGYAATTDLSQSGLRRAAEQAQLWAERTAGVAVFDFGSLSMPHAQGTYKTPVEQGWESMSLADKIDLLKSLSARLKTHDKIVDWEAGLWHVHHDMLYLTSQGGQIRQTTALLCPQLSVTANEGTNTQTRSLRDGECQQGGLEVMDRMGFRQRPDTLSREVLELLEAANCPSGKMDLLLAPDQMMLQIHESIGHPLELDRILGDERNYAGTSFVTLDMLGSYQYGSELLNITFDPSRRGQFASYGYDDDGVPAERTFIIEKGILKRPLGSIVSQTRASRAGDLIEGVANARGTGWNRPPIDRMANLNLEPGVSTFDELVRSIEKGVYMRTNCSWSIDDSRNKFQFGCEWGQLIENGALTTVVKNPNYRGISATFWRNLSGVGSEDTFEVLGTPFCGKGEPNQIIRVGHASPVCRFSNVAIFGGE